MRRLSPTGILGFALVILAGSPARAEGAKVALEAIDCNDLQVPEVERVLELELNQVASKLQGGGVLSATLVCKGSFLQISIADPLTGKHLNSSIPAPPEGQVGREREIALAVSERVFRSWLEVLIKARAVNERERGDRSDEKPAPLPKKPLAHSLVVEPEVDVGGGAHLHDIAAPFYTGSPTFAAALVFGDRWRAVMRTALELGSAHRTLGSVSALGVVVGFGAGWRSPRIGGVVAFDIDLVGNAVYARFAGEDTGADVQAKQASGVALGSTLAVGPKIFFGAFHVGLTADASTTFAPLTATIDDEPPARFGHASFGLALNVGFALRESSGARELQ